MPGLEAAGMFGKLIVGDVKEVVSKALDVAKDPYHVGEPVGDRAPQHIEYDLLTTEVEGQLSDGSTYRYWTFDNTVPGPKSDELRVGEECVSTGRSRGSP